MSSKQILITSYFLWPEATPRAFRAEELAKEFARRGHDVTLCVPRTGADRGEFARSHGVRVLETASGFLLNRRAKQRPKIAGGSAAHGRRRRIRKALGRIKEYCFPGGRSFEFFLPLALRLRRDARRYDMIVSIGLPLGTHVGTALGMAGRKAGAVAIADYGDPFSFREDILPCGFHARVERAALRFFDHVTIPVATAAPCFRPLVADERLHVVPQGFDLEEVVRLPNRSASGVRFAYAGIFYPGLRDPGVLLEQLANSHEVFEFVIYTDTSHVATMSLLAPYRERLGRRLVVMHSLPRTECIRELSAFDFLVNQENMTGSQTPSKLIDYALAGPPVYSFRQDRFEPEALGRFLRRDFSEAIPPVDLSRHDIRRVADAFLGLSAPRGFLAEAIP